MALLGCNYKKANTSLFSKTVNIRIDHNFHMKARRENKNTLSSSFLSDRHMFFLILNTIKDINHMLKGRN